MARRDIQHQQDKKDFMRQFNNPAIGRSSSLFGSLFGWLLRFAVLFVVLALIAGYYSRSKLNGRGLRTAVQAELDRVLQTDVENTELTNFRWKGFPWENVEGRSKSFKATGGPGSFFTTLEVEGIHLNAGWKEMMKSDAWKVEELKLDHVTAHVRSSPTEQKAEKKNARKNSLFGPTPDLERCDLGQIVIADLNLTWGSHWASKGSLEGASALLSRAEDGWDMAVSGGKFTQNWLKDLELNSITVKKRPGKILLSEGAFVIGSGAGHISGIIDIGARPGFNIKVVGNAIPLKPFLPKDAAEIAGELFGSLTMKVTGTTGDAKGLKTEGGFEVQRGALRGIKLLTDMGFLTSHPDLRRFPVSEGMIRFSTQTGRLEASSIELKYKEIAAITGNLVYQQDLALLDPETIVEDPAPEEEENGDEPAYDYKLSGNLELAIASDLLNEWKFLKRDFFVPSSNENFLKVGFPLETPCEKTGNPLADKIGEQLQIERDRNKGTGAG